MEINTGTVKEPNTRLTAAQLKDLEDTLDEDPGATREVATILLENTTSEYARFELNQVLYMIGKDKQRQLNSVIFAVIMKSIPAKTGGSMRGRSRSRKAGKARRCTACKKRTVRSKRRQ